MIDFVLCRNTKEVVQYGTAAELTSARGFEGAGKNAGVINKPTDAAHNCIGTALPNGTAAPRTE